jgi:hypothetical protein
MKPSRPAPHFLSYCPRAIVPNFTGRVKVSPFYGLTFFRSGNGIFRDRNTTVCAARLILRFSQRMDHAINDGSKLCAEVPRHATENFLSEISMAQLGKGQGFAPPRCIPSPVPQAAAETVPVSAPSARCAVVAFAAWAVCP